LTTVIHQRDEACFFERDPNIPLVRRTTVEAAGTLLLVFAVVGSGLTSQHVLHQTPAFGLFTSAVATAGALVGLILALGSVSGGHFNPLISSLQWLAGERRFDCALAYVAAQFAGGLVGALLANVTFGADRQLEPPPADWRLALSEIIATSGLMIIVFGCARSGRSETGPIAVGLWLAAAIIATPSASYANPAIAISALVAVGPTALSLRTVLFYMPAEVAGALLALAVVSIAYPRRRSSQRKIKVPSKTINDTISRSS
jgi:glycerol uptake facilitator-like aquaporin